MLILASGDVCQGLSSQVAAVAVFLCFDCYQHRPSRNKGAPHIQQSDEAHPVEESRFSFGDLGSSRAAFGP
jgi:hypothetical protein